MTRPACAAEHGSATCRSRLLHTAVAMAGEEGSTISGFVDVAGAGDVEAVRGLLEHDVADLSDPSEVRPPNTSTADPVTSWRGAPPLVFY